MIYLIHGPPASGKSSLAQMLGSKLNLFVLSRDSYFETIVDTLGRTPEGLGQAIYDLSLKMFCELADTNNAFIYEGTINPVGTADFIKKNCKIDTTPICEVFLTAPHEVLIQRYKARAYKDRHWSHNDQKRSLQLSDHLNTTQYMPLGFKDFFQFETEKISCPEIVGKILDR